MASRMGRGERGDRLEAASWAGSERSRAGSGAVWAGLGRPGLPWDGSGTGLGTVWAGLGRSGAGLGRSGPVLDRFGAGPTVWTVRTVWAGLDRVRTGVGSGLGGLGWPGRTGLGRPDR